MPRNDPQDAARNAGGQADSAQPRSSTTAKMNPSFCVDGERLRRDIERNAQFGMVATDEGQARTVLPGTEPNRGARQHLVDRMIQAGLTVDVDAVGNIYGTYEPQEYNPDAAAVAVGSHLDSVPCGGIFDGPLGVYAGLEAVRTLRDAKISLTRPIQVVCFTGEEGTRFADGVLGSSVAAGELSVEAALSLTDDETTLREALTDIGFNGEGRLNASEWEAWFELHVEQSTKLEQLGLPAGVVTTITGTTRLHVTIKGDADHTGTTSMTNRTDALAAASEFVLAVERAAQESPETAVATVGELSVDPGTVNVVPGSIKLSIDIRDIDTDVIEELEAKIRGALTELEATRGVETDVSCSYSVDPVKMAPRCCEALRRAGTTVGVETADVHSGAGHDSMQIARATDTGLLFAPSEGGHSHSKLEWTAWNACTATTEVLTAALADIAG